MNKDWFTEYSNNKTIASSFKVKEVLHQEKSKWQEITVLDTCAVGKLLLLDGKAMISDKDEFVYHEVMSHIPIMVTPNVEHVLIIGGGDGGLVREYAKHPEIKKIDLVEIDERVVKVAQEFFPDCTSGLDDPRVTVHFKDGIEFIEKCQNRYDIIIIDSTDPENFAIQLFSEKFYAQIFKILTDTGVMMNQTEGPFFDEYGIKNIYDNMRSAFPLVRSLAAPMVIYPGIYWTFGFSSQKTVADEIISDKIAFMENLQKSLKWYNMDWHRACFKLPNLHRTMTGI